MWLLDNWFLFSGDGFGPSFTRSSTDSLCCFDLLLTICVPENGGEVQEGNNGRARAEDKVLHQGQRVAGVVSSTNIFLEQSLDAQTSRHHSNRLRKDSNSLAPKDKCKSACPLLFVSTLPFARLWKLWLQRKMLRSAVHRRNSTQQFTSLSVYWCRWTTFFAILFDVCWIGLTIFALFLYSIYHIVLNEA